MAKTTPSRAKSKTKAPKKQTFEDLFIEFLKGQKQFVDLVVADFRQVNAKLDKLASPTVAVEEKWVPKVGEWVVSIYDIEPPHHLYQWGNVSGDYDHEVRPATSEEIAAHEAKVKSEAEAAEDAKLVFGARVEVRGSGDKWLYLSHDSKNWYRLARSTGSELFERHQFTLLP